MVFSQGVYDCGRLLALNDYVMEKAFVFGVICMSKWMREEVFPQGVYVWPPAMPEPPAPARGGPRALDVDQETDLATM